VSVKAPSSVRASQRRPTSTTPPVCHGHPRSSDLRPLYYRCAGARMVGMGSLGRTAGATSGPHPGHEPPDCSGQQRSLPAPHLPSSPDTLPRPPQVAAILHGSLTRKSATVVPPRHMPTRQHHWAMALRGQEETAGLEKARQRPGSNVYDRFEVLQRGVSAPTREASPSEP
jgi:hypothetical protein